MDYGSDDSHESCLLVSISLGSLLSRDSGLDHVTCFVQWHNGMLYTRLEKCLHSEACPLSKLESLQPSQSQPRLASQRMSNQVERSCNHPHCMKHVLNYLDCLMLCHLGDCGHWIADCSSQSLRAGSHWPSLDHMPLAEPVTVASAGRGLSHPRNWGRAQSQLE